MSNHSDKLQLGWERFQKAGNDPELLGYALISFHGALEDYFRDWLSNNNFIDPQIRHRVQDKQQVQWKELIDLMQQYGGVSLETRNSILNANRLRQQVAHGSRFSGTRADVEAYANLVQQLMDNYQGAAFASRNPRAASNYSSPNYNQSNSSQIANAIDSFTNEIKTLNNNRLSTSYILCAFGLLGIGGLHRLYNGRFATGVLWLCTGGLFYVGQLVDVFLMPGMVEEYEARLRSRAGISPFGVPVNQPVVATQVQRPNGNQLMIKLIEAAENNGGRLSVTQGVKATGANFAEVETALKEMYKSGYARIDNDPDTGAVTYYFHEISS